MTHFCKKKFPDSQGTNFVAMEQGHSQNSVGSGITMDVTQGSIEQQKPLSVKHLVHNVDVIGSNTKLDSTGYAILFSIVLEAAIATIY